mgnify:CR=1 FL=1
MEKSNQVQQDNGNLSIYERVRCVPKEAKKEIDARLDEAALKYRELKEKIKACADEDSDEVFDLGLAEFNLSNYMIMLDDKISMLRSQIEAEK